MRDAYEILLGPLVTEKMTAVAEKARVDRSSRAERTKKSKKAPKPVAKAAKGDVVAFRVRPDANKIEIRQAVERIWKVKVDGVRTQRYDGKLKRLGRFSGRRAAWKKAIVTLAEGQSIPELT